ncbi:MAG: SCO family protein [Actinobacteria bacterium]|nr:SCO family protein [Actinomycetota bacterium]MBS1882510.1 SCO family protein [Actinomycetota bacterium]
MPPRSRLLPVLCAALVLGLVVAGCGGGSSSSSNAAQSIPAIAGGDAVPAKNAPPIELTDQYGKKVDLAKLKGHSVLIAFLYTHCTDLCPIVAGKVHTAYAQIPKAQRPVFLAVSVDPAHDTPASAATFNKRHRTTGEIDWLLGSRAELEKVWTAWGVKPVHNANDPEEIEHNAEIFAVDPQGQIRALYPPNFKPEKLAIGTKTLAQL